MSRDGRTGSIGDELDATRWDYRPPDSRRAHLLRPAGATFANLPWDAEARPMPSPDSGPAPAEDTEPAPGS